MARVNFISLIHSGFPFVGLFAGLHARRLPDEADVIVPAVASPLLQTERTHPLLCKGYQGACFCSQSCLCLFTSFRQPFSILLSLFSSILLVVVSLLNLSLWAYCVMASLASVITRESDLDWAADAVDQLTNQRVYTSFPLSLCFPFFLPRNTQWMATPRRRQSKKNDAQQVFTI